MWSDVETSEDLLGYTVHADLLKQVIMEEGNLPVTIGLYGDWGSGKSSILKILQNKIETAEDSKNESVVIYFDGWSFESFDDAKMALMQGIVDKLEEKITAKKTFTNCAKKVKDNIFSLRTLMWLLRNVAAPIGLAAISGGITTIPSLLSAFGSFKGKETELAEKLTGDDAEKFLKEITDLHIDVDKFSAVREFRINFEKLIEATNKKRVVILIDDLDRCLPEHIIDNLEAIKLFLNVKNTAFVIAADQRIVSGAIHKQYKEIADLNNSSNGSERSIGEKYLDKFIQIPFSIPKLSNQEVETYIMLLFCKSQLKKKDFEVIHDDYQNFIVKHKFENYGWDNIKNLKGVANNPSLEHMVTFITHCTPIISSSLERNPRLIKRFLNAYELRNQLLKQNGMGDEHKSFLLIKLMLLETSHSPLFKRLYDWSVASKGHPEEIKELEKQAKNGDIDDEKYKDWNKPDVIGLLAMDPMFSSIDLRDIYWVSRDKILDGMGGISMVSQKVRDIFEKLCNSSSETILENTCEQEVKYLTGYELKSFYDLMDGKLMASPEEQQAYDIYFYVIKADTDEAFPHFLETFSKTTTKAPISISNIMKRLLVKYHDDKNLVASIKKNQALSRMVWRDKNKKK